MRGPGGSSGDGEEDGHGVRGGGDVHRGVCCPFVL